MEDLNGLLEDGVSYAGRQALGTELHLAKARDRALVVCTQALHQGPDGFAVNCSKQLRKFDFSLEAGNMTSKKGLSFVVALLAQTVFAFTFREWPGAMPTAGHAGDEQTIRQLNEECLKAHDTGDVATLDRIEDADFTISGDFGVVGKQQQLDRVRKRTSKPEVITRKIDPQQFRFYDRVALVTETDRPTTADGTFAFQSTEVWVRRGDSWNLVHLHYSRVEQKQ